MINAESYVDRSARRASRAMWKQSQCIASGTAAGLGVGGILAAGFSGGQQPINRSHSALSHSQKSSVSISSGSVRWVLSSYLLFVTIPQITPSPSSSIASSLATSHGNVSAAAIHQQAGGGIGGLSGLGNARPIATARHATLPYR